MIRSVPKSYKETHALKEGKDALRKVVLEILAASQEVVGKQRQSWTSVM